jgi:hypothetical protein
LPGKFYVNITSNAMPWPHSQGREAGRSARDPADESRTGHNVKTAKTLGVSFPLFLLGRADAVIE